MTEERTRRLAAVWFADIVGYTALSAKDEDAALEVVDELQRIAGEAVEERGGRVVKYLGDAVLTVFDSVDGALHAAFNLQIGFAKSRVVKKHGVALRVGLHLGEIVEAEDGDVYGDGVNTASRIEGVARPGEVAVTESVFQQIRNRPQFETEELGKKELKGLDSMAVYSVTLADAPPILVAQRQALAPKPSYRRAAGVGIAASVLGFVFLTVFIAQTQDTGTPNDGQTSEQVVRGGASGQPSTEGGEEGRAPGESQAGDLSTAATDSEDGETPDSDLASGAGDDSPDAGVASADDETPAGEPPATAAPPRFGDWVVDSGTDFMDDSEYARLELPAARGSARLILECRRNHALRIEWPRALASNEVEVRMGTRVARAAGRQWAVEGESTLVYQGDPRRFIRELLGIQGLAIQATALSGPRMGAQFRLTGLRQALDELRSACAL